MILLGTKIKVENNAKISTITIVTHIVQSSTEILSYLVAKSKNTKHLNFMILSSPPKHPKNHFFHFNSQDIITMSKHGARPGHDTKRKHDSNASWRRMLRHAPWHCQSSHQYDSWSEDDCRWLKMTYASLCPCTLEASNLSTAAFTSPMVAIRAGIRINSLLISSFLIINYYLAH